MRTLTSDNIKEAVNGKMVFGSGNAEIRRVITDSREAGPGDVFFALKGEKNDGHDYLAQVLKNGCRALVVSDMEKTEATVPVMATGLVKHRVLIGSVEKAGYWVGIGIPRADKGKALFKQSYTAIDDPSTISDWSEGLDSVWPSPTAEEPTR